MCVHVKHKFMEGCMSFTLVSRMSNDNYYLVTKPTACKADNFRPQCACRIKGAALLSVG